MFTDGAVLMFLDGTMKAPELNVIMHSSNSPANVTMRKRKEDWWIRTTVGSKQICSNLILLMLRHTPPHCCHVFTLAYSRIPNGILLV
jgi:hypothetical protein